MNRYQDILNKIQENLNITQSIIKSDCDPDDSPEECKKEKLEDKLELEMMKQKLAQLKRSKGEDFTTVEAMTEETVLQQMMEYKNDFYQMSIGSLKAIMMHAKSILDNLDSPDVKNNLTAPHLQGIIAVAEDHMRGIHDFVMFVEGFADNSESSSNPGLWDNIREKKQREGKKYKPAKPGDPDRPDPKMWKKLTKDSNK